MKKIINTETAELIHEWNNRRHINDSYYCSEDLYRTKQGQYFLVGEGGKMSIYAINYDNSAINYGNSRESGCIIKLLTYAEAIEWLKENDGEEVLEKYFSDVIEEE